MWWKYGRLFFLSLLFYILIEIFTNTGTLPALQGYKPDISFLMLHISSFVLFLVGCLHSFWLATVYCSKYLVDTRLVHLFGQMDTPDMQLTVFSGEMLANQTPNKSSSSCWGYTHWFWKRFYMCRGKFMLSMIPLMLKRTLLNI